MVGRCEEAMSVVDEIYERVLDAVMDNAEEEIETLLCVAKTLKGLVARRLDEATMWAIEHSDRYVNEKDEMQLECVGKHIRVGLWVNIAKDPRVKMIQFPEMGFTMDIPKTLALFSHAVRVTYVKFDSGLLDCGDDALDTIKRISTSKVEEEDDPNSLLTNPSYTPDERERSGSSSARVAQVKHL